MPHNDQTWPTRRIHLIGDRPAVDRVCREWEGEGWLVRAVEPAEPTRSGHPCFAVTVAVPPRDWQPVQEDDRIAQAADASTG